MFLVLPEEGARWLRSVMDSPGGVDVQHKDMGKIGHFWHYLYGLSCLRSPEDFREGGEGGTWFGTSLKSTGLLATAGGNSWSLWKEQTTEMQLFLGWRTASNTHTAEGEGGYHDGCNSLLSEKCRGISACPERVGFQVLSNKRSSTYLLRCLGRYREGQPKSSGAWGNCQARLKRPGLFGLEKRSLRRGNMRSIKS